MTTIRKSALALAVLTGLAGSPSLLAQQTASAIKGSVVNSEGEAISGAVVILKNERTGILKTVETSDSGQFSLSKLPIGTGYSISINKPGFTAQSQSDIPINLGSKADLNFVLSGETAAEEEVVTTAQLRTFRQVAAGPSSSFNLNDLQNRPAINRNLTDTLRIDPRVYVDPGRGSIQCAGKNPRFNSLTVDGVRLNDSFGLNSNGYPTERMPFSYDAINQVSVELAPFDVEYGGFTACNINAVTKSGSNEVEGGFFYDFTSDALQGNSLEGDDIESGSFDETRMGFHVGFPLVKDTLFAFVSYEKLDGVNIFDRGPIGSQSVQEVAVTQDELDEISKIAKDIYMYDPGDTPISMPNEDEKILLKLDWNITDAQRLSLTYNYNDGFNIAQSDGDANEFEFSNHLYERGAELNSYVGTLYSNWTSNFSTELRIGMVELENRQLSLGGTDFGEVQVALDNVTVYLGSDDSRQSNELNYDLFNFSLKAAYDLDQHNLSFGIEQEAFDVFNLFVQHTETELRFSGIENFRDGYASAIYYNNAPSSEPEDAAAEWGYEISTAYIQDEIEINDRTTLVAGLRYDLYTSDDRPEENADFVADYGFSNSSHLDGLGLLQPRLSIDYEANSQWTLRGGLGLYTGGNPNVWLSNNFSANNVLQFGQRGRSFGYTDGSRSLFDDDVVYAAIEEGAPAGAGAGWGVPSELYDAVEAGSGDNFEINYLDPDFKLPSEWKLSFGTDYETASGYNFAADILFSKAKDTAIIKRGDIEQIGVSDAGYPIYESVREASFVLTNSSVGDKALMISLSVNKQFDNGIDWTAGYAYSDAQDVQPMTSSVAFSNYQNRAFFDPQEEILSTSDYNIAHRFTSSLAYTANFISDLDTHFSLVGFLNEGSPYSNTLGGGENDIYSYTPYLEGNNVLASCCERNSQTGSWWAKADLQISQEFPGFTAAQKGTVFFAVDNFTNLLNDEWGILREATFPGNVSEDDLIAEPRQGDESLYSILLGVRYKF